ncbi:putative kinase mug58 [Erysiphe neolycopersici]|uniref:Putative kinase mug58 n=1 Tax=Erysiphe neolycopersici TaxID=212602 RepID=A0A420I2L4_9PEZI|nr:putative kinase mug58 [Erysiphe neolycopersici]
MGNSDDKSHLIISFILSLHLMLDKSPLFVALNGAQGIGKSTLGTMLARRLSDEHGLRTIVISIDDFYLPHAEQLTLAQANRNNKLVQHRGLPGTHDLNLAKRVLSALANGSKCEIPAFDKGAHHGNGDRIARHLWRVVNQTEDLKIQVVIFEGWCIGFSPLTDDAVEWKQNKMNYKSLINHDLNDLLFINERLKEYEEVFNAYFDGFVYIDAKDLGYVYSWREEQEKSLRKQKGWANAMSPRQVVEFVDNYFPAYELYTEALRLNGIVSRKDATRIKEIRIVVDRDRRVLEVYKS